MDYKPDVALGLLMVACAPGGGDSNAVAYLVDGELPLSISMTFFSTILAIGKLTLKPPACKFVIKFKPHFDIPSTLN